MDERERDRPLSIGDWVRVAPNCHLTLPAYARILKGTVVEITEDGLVQIAFGPDRSFPLPPECVEVTDPPPDERA